MGKLHQFTLHLQDDKGRHISSYNVSALVYFVLTYLFAFNQVVLFIRIYAALRDEDVLTYIALSKAVIFTVKRVLSLTIFQEF